MSRAETDPEDARRMVRAIAIRLTDLGVALDTAAEAIALVSSAPV
jgi:hypothetical protein